MTRVVPRLEDNDSSPYGPRTGDGDQLVVMHGVDWRTYGTLRELIDSPGIRMTYLHGALEIMNPSRRHEHEKTSIARMIEVFALERDVALQGYGSTTFKREALERGLEPDECYCVGHDLGDAPDIALEVVITSGGINELVPELDFGAIEECVKIPDQHAAVKTFRDRLRSPRS